ncbi:MAG TPA: peptidase M28, partial [Acidobacteriota bacterium]|nr:peptidase M28 [Acidobacteriota bacterium]
MKTSALIIFMSITLVVFAISNDEVDLSAVHKIKDEAFQNGKVMDHLFYLTDINGPRLSGSPEFQKAAEWIVNRLKEWGISNARLDSWGEFGRSWSLQKFSAHLLKPTYAPLQAFPLAWTPSTSGTVKANVVYAPLLQSWEGWLTQDPTRLSEKIKSYEAKYKGQLNGKIVLVDLPRELQPSTTAPFKRFTDEELTGMTEAPTPF